MSYINFKVTNSKVVLNKNLDSQRKSSENYTFFPCQKLSRWTQTILI